MKLAFIFTLIALLQLNTIGFSQTVTLSLKNAPLEKAFEEIERQTNFRFAYTKEEMDKSLSITVHLKNAELRSALVTCFKQQPLLYAIRGNQIVIYVKEEKYLPVELHDLKGKVSNLSGEPVPGASIGVKGSSRIVITDKNGQFELNNIDQSAIIVVSGAEIETQERKTSNLSYIEISVIARISELDQVLVMAYGETTRRLNTGNIGKITADEIIRQPVSNPLAALQGRVPGLVVTQTSGVPGSAFKIQVRGQNSISQGSDPLFIVDGVPYSPGNATLSQLASAANNPFQSSQGGLSPFNLINPLDIESIEILKDADATAIYGSRGANGVILITTKKGHHGKIQLNTNIYSGWSKVTRTMNMMNTQQYLQMRREAFANDNTPLSIARAPDLLLWDTTRYTDFKDLLIGGRANTLDAMVSLSGGNSTTQFSLSGGYRRETTVFPGDMSDTRGTFHLNLHHSSPDKKFALVLTTTYASEKNNLIARDLTSSLILPPNFPSLYDSSGRLKWKEGQVSFGSLGLQNPCAYLRQDYIYSANNLAGNLQVSYKIAAPLTFRASIGYNNVYTIENLINPIAAQDPSLNPTGVSQFSNGNIKSWIAEPQLEYNNKLKNATLNIILGGTWQENNATNTINKGEGYSNDAFLNSLNGAASVTATNGFSQYRYYAFFGRITYNWQEKYILNLSGRRDGSSRFGPGKQFENFGAVGAAWIFSKEKAIPSRLPFLSFGKLRVSYGITGNDQIGDYYYLDSWANAYTQYQNTPTLIPNRLYNPDYRWEINRKFEAAIELGFLKDRFLFSVAYFRNISSNQLIDYRLSTQTGFSSVFQNTTASVRNNGVEIIVSGKILKRKSFQWSASLNLTIPGNKLIAFPNLLNSSYASVYVEGKSLSVITGYKYLGVDPATGIYTFDDVNKDGVLNSNDFQSLGHRDPKLYGGLNNSITFKDWELTIFAEFKKQTGRSYLTAAGNFIPGFRFNQPEIVLSRWQNTGDMASFQRFTQGFTPAFFALRDNLYLSDGAYSDASYLRIKNISLSYQVAKALLSKLKISGCKLYMLAQNLFTLTHYAGADPETQNLYILPPLKTVTAGIKLTL